MRNDKWEIIGPGGGGSQYRPTVSPHDPNTALVACDMTGSYITNDGGLTWREFNLGGGTSAFYFDPVRADMIYAGSNGLYRSEDGGEKWRLLFPDPAAVEDELMVGDHSSNILVTTDNWPGNARISGILVDEKRLDHIYVSLHSYAADERGLTRIFFSADDGRKWSELCRIAGRDAYKMYLNPHSYPDNQRLFVFTDCGLFAFRAASGEVEQLKLPEQITRIHHASCGFNPNSNKTIFYLSSPAKWEGQKLFPGLWKSTDLGQSWQELPSVIDSSMAGPETKQTPDFTLLAACERDARHVYLAVNRYPEIPEQSGAGSIIRCWGFMKSEDEGESWKWVYKSDYHTTTPKLKAGWVERNYSPSWNGISPKGVTPLGLSVCASNPDFCLASDMGSSYRTSDGGQTWAQTYSNDHLDGSVSTNGMDVTTCYGVHFDPFDQDHIVISYTDTGLFHSFNAGRTWHHSLNGISPVWGNTCYWVVFDPDVKGRAWAAWGYAHDLPRPKMFLSDFYLHQGGVGRTEDGLMTWRQSNGGMPENCVTTYIMLDPNSPIGNRTLYAAVFDKGVYKSTDDGRTWVLKNDGISGNFNAWRLALLPDGTLFLLVARGLRRGKEIDGAVYKSVDGGESWRKLTLVEGINAPNDLVFDTQNPNRLYLACWPKTIDGTEYFGGVYVSEDGGETWENTFDSSKHVYGIAIDPNRPSTLFINTFDNAAYRTDDGGASWIRLKGYNFKWGHSPFIDPYNKDKIYLTTFGSSVWHGPAHGDEEAFEDIYPLRRREQG